ncbi:aminotransferase class IV [Candidatus Amoebophilus asiaticus]|nr:aminotransferase class IV [Candidatus Amoebophilus asiaticus]
MPSKFINHNGYIADSSKAIFSCHNRAFRYGDGLFETIRMINGKIKLLKEHYHRLSKGMHLLKMHIPDQFSISFFDNLIKELLKKNSLTQNARIRVTIYRNEGGLYVPFDNAISYLIEVEPLKSEVCQLNEKGYKIDIFSEAYKPTYPLSNLKTTNCLIYILAGLYKTENDLDDCVIMNSNNHIAEAISSNIFIYQNKLLLTPSLNDGCVEGIMRNQIIQLAKDNDIQISERSLTYHDLANADEVFLTNAIDGIKWVGQFKDKMYKNGLAIFLSNKIEA